MSIVTTVFKLFTKEASAEEKGKSGKYLDWGTAIGGTITAALLQGKPKIENFEPPTLFGSIIIAVLLLLFVSTDQRRVKMFVLKGTVLLLLMATMVFETNRFVIASKTFTYSSVDGTRKENILKGMWMNPRADSIQTARSISDSQLLQYYAGEYDQIWPRESQIASQVVFDVLYLSGLALIGLTLIAATDVLLAQQAKRRINTSEIL